MTPATLRTLALGLTLLHSGAAYAQNDLPNLAPGFGGGPPPGGGSQAPPPSDLPETHAAPGGTESTLPQGKEPSLPTDPLDVSEATLAQIGSDGDPASLGTGDDASRDFYGLYYDETSGDYRYRVAFPLWAERKMPSLSDPKIEDRSSVFGGVYYNRRSAEHEDDVLFPIAWNLRNPLEKARTTVVGPFVNRRTQTETDDWLLPLYATGTRADGGYTIIPPLLTYRDRDIFGGLNILGPAFCSWEGGQSCDTRTAQSVDLGIVPFYFFGQHDKGLYEVIPPLGHYYSYNSQLDEWTNIYGPYYRRHTEKREMFHLLPFYWSIWGEKERHTTVAPLFHYGYDEKESLLVTPLFLNKKGENDSSTFVTWGYARHRGETELDMVTPLYWNFRDPRIGLQRHLLFPFFYSNESPRESTTAVLPLFAHQKRFGVSESLWLTPLFNYTTHTQGWSTKLLPGLFFGRDGHDSHAVAAPLYFDFKSLHERTTIVPPALYVRHRGRDSLTHIFANMYYHERRYRSGSDWEFHFLPLFSYGENPNGHFWNVLFGLAGYQRQGPKSTVKALWVPFNISE